MRQGLSFCYFHPIPGHWASISASRSLGSVLFEELADWRSWVAAALILLGVLMVGAAIAIAFRRQRDAYTVTATASYTVDSVLSDAALAHLAPVQLPISSGLPAEEQGTPRGDHVHEQPTVINQLPFTAGLRILTGPLAGQVFAVGYHGFPVTLGRESGQRYTIAFDDERISRKHASIELHGDALTLTDMGSTNGTLVAGQRLQPATPVQLAVGSEFTIGETVCVIVSPGTASDIHTA